MRLTTRILSLINISVALSCYFRYPAECDKEMAEYNNCIEGEDIAYNTEKCQNYYQKHFELLPKCKSVLSEVNIRCKETNHLFTYGDLILKFEGIDENGEKCPLAAIEEIPDEEKEDYNKRLLAAAKNSCGSKKCIDVSIKAYNKLYEAKKIDWEIETDEFYEALLKTLKTCDSTSTPSTNTEVKANTSDEKENKAKKAKTITTTTTKAQKAKQTTTTKAQKAKQTTTTKAQKAKQTTTTKAQKAKQTTTKTQKAKQTTTKATKAKATAAAKVNTNTKSNVKISTNGKCGKSEGRCPSGQCCSKYGYCGRSSAHCKIGCQSEFGICN